MDQLYQPGLIILVHKELNAHTFKTASEIARAIAQKHQLSQKHQIKSLHGRVWKLLKTLKENEFLTAQEIRKGHIMTVTYKLNDTKKPD